MRARRLTEVIHYAAGRSAKRTSRPKATNAWWTQELTKARARLKRFSRIWPITRTEKARDQLHEQRHKYAKMLKQARKHAWKFGTEEGNARHWGLPYKILTGGLRNSHT